MHPNRASMLKAITIEKYQKWYAEVCRTFRDPMTEASELKATLRLLSPIRLDPASCISTLTWTVSIPHIRIDIRHKQYYTWR